MDPGLAIPILPARDLHETRAFYERLGFATVGWWPDAFGGYAVLTRGDLAMHFYHAPDVLPHTNHGQCYWYVADVAALHADAVAAGIPATGTPRLTPIDEKPWACASSRSPIRTATWCASGSRCARRRTIAIRERGGIDAPGRRTDHAASIVLTRAHTTSARGDSVGAVPRHARGATRARDVAPDSPRGARARSDGRRRDDAVRRRGPLHAPTMRIPRPLSVAALLVLGAPLAAQSAVPDAPIGRASGTAYDSLAARPLAGALVLAPGGRAAVVDSGGRWTLDSLPAGRVRLTLAHPALDSLGLYAEGDTVTVVAGGDAIVHLATPSFARVAGRLCPRGVTDDAGIVFGVLADGAGTLYEGGRVSATWTDLTGAVAAIGSARRGGAAAPALETRSDARGSYALCGVPLEQGTLVQGLTDRGGTGALEVTVGARRLLRLDLVASDVRAAAVARTAVLAGVLRDSAGRPLSGATVVLVGDGPSTRSDAEGRYRLAALPDGSQSVEIVAIGYLPVREIVGLRAGRTTTLDAALQRAHVLPVVAVRAAAARRFQQELERRKLMGFGHVRTAAQLERYPQVVSALQDVPSLTVKYDRGRFWLELRRIGCTPQVFVDGQLQNPELIGRKTTAMDPTAMLQSLGPTDLAGLEVYENPMHVPIQYRSQLNRCGAVLAWTKWYAERP